MTLQRRVGLSIAILGTAAIIWATASPGATNAAPQGMSLCFLCDSDALADAIDNVILFLPFGFGWRMAGGRPIYVALAGFALTLLVETLQLRVIVGRDPSVRDIAMNTIGTLVGIAIAHYKSWFARPSPRRARGLYRASLAAWILLVFAGGIVLAPDYHRARCFVDWAPTGGDGDWFHGHLVRASLNGRLLSAADDVTSSCTAMSLRQAHAAQLLADIVPGTPTFEGSTIVGLHDDNGDFLALSQNGTALTLDLRTRAVAWRLRSPILRIPRGASKQNGDSSRATLHLEGLVSRDHLRLISTDGTQSARAELTLSPFLVWTAILPSRLQTSAYASLITSLFWLAVLFPIGYYGRWRFDETYAFHGSAAELLLALLIVVMVQMALGYTVAFGLPWIGAGCGIVAGALAATIYQSHRPARSL